MYRILDLFSKGLLWLVWKTTIRSIENVLSPPPPPPFLCRHVGDKQKTGSNVILQPFALPSLSIWIKIAALLKFGRSEPWRLESVSWTFFDTFFFLLSQNIRMWCTCGNFECWRGKPSRWPKYTVSIITTLMSYFYFYPFFAAINPQVIVSTLSSSFMWFFFFFFKSLMLMRILHKQSLVVHQIWAVRQTRGRANRKDWCVVMLPFLLLMFCKIC